MKLDGEAAFRASGCTNMLAFLSTLAPDLHRITFNDEGKMLFWNSKDNIELEFGDVDELRAQEESTEAGSFIRFLSALPSSSSHLVFGTIYDNEVKLASEHELSALFDAIASPSCTLQSLNLGAPLTIISSSDSNYSSAKVCQSIIGDALCQNTSLTSLFISSRSHMDIIEKHLLPALTRPHSSIKSLEVWLDPHQHTLDCLLPIFTALALNTASSLTHLEVNNSGSKQAINYSSDLVTQLGKMLSTNKSLISFELYELYLPGTLVHSLFNSLESNVHLTRLSLWKCGGEDWPSASSVLDCLRVNAFLHELDLGDTPLAGQMEAAIRAQLKRNKEIAVLKTENTKQVQPTAVRLFLCGFPFSGKTTLASSLHKCLKKKTTLPLPTYVKYYLSCATCCSNKTMLQRTRGIEVRMLEQEDKVKVSLWDLAGQAQYHAFHDNMFPNLSSDATPSLFLFVWNPIQLHESNGHEILNPRGGESMMKTLEMFKQEFRYWLKFIASKTLPSSKFKPRLLVAITRADRLQSRVVHLESGIKNWLKNTFNQCHEEFKEYIQFDMEEGYFEMDARNPNQIKGLARHIFQCAQDVLHSAPLVYQACDNARRVISDLVHKKRSADPVIKKEKFFFILEEHLHLSSKEILEAIALSLNDSGDIIYFQSSDLVVLDTQWFCHHIMGDLLYFHGSEFQTSEAGTFSLEVLKELLESKFNTTSHSKYSKFNRCEFTSSSTKIEGETLIELLIGLRLACHQDNSSNIFIPASLCSKTPRQIHHSQYFKDEGNTYMGRRLKCKDSVRTFFTPGIFPSIQVTFRQIFSRVQLEEDIIAFSRDGVNVFAKFCKLQGEDHFIDILICSSLNLDKTIKWVYGEVLNNMERVCAHPRGIQGVEIMYEVINPLWVQAMNVDIDDKRKQSVPIEELRDTINHYLDKNGFEPNLLDNILYTWQTTNSSNHVLELLGGTETQRVIESYQSNFIIDIEDALDLNMEEEFCFPREKDEKLFRSSKDGEEKNWIIIYDKLEKMHKDIKIIHEELQKIKDNISTLCNVVVPKLQLRMDEMLTFTKEGEAGKLPRLFVVTKKDGVIRKIIATMVPGLQNVRLELLCEHRRQPHLVDDRPGLSLNTMDDGLLKRGLPYVIKILKMFQVAVKVGVHVATSVGEAIPDFARVLASIEATPRNPILPTYFESNAPSTSRTTFQEGQQWLLEVLSLKDCCTSKPIHDMFGLSRVRYPDSQVRWLCDEHCCEGQVCPI